MNAPWESRSGVAEVVARWREADRVRECVVADTRLPAEAGAPLPPERLARPLDPRLLSALAARGIESLYRHQVQGIDAARAGKHVVIATPTASGKSLCFHLPVLDALAADPHARALYLYPTKALSRDQEHTVRALAKSAELDLGAAVFDGDTPGDARRAVRDHARLVLTNPDMLHSGILPSHPRWAALFQGLRYVIIDELHTYRGVFGSHMAHVLARLQRIARFHGADPVFITATATIGNPREHAARLISQPPESIELVNESGAPRGARQLYVYNPPIVNEELGLRGSALKHAVSLAADLVRARVPTLVFGPSRNSVEVMLKYLRAEVGDVAGPDAIMAYRGGYLPETRRRVERGLRDGQILCVVSTNALELGIDIGELSAVVSVGYPGSIAATWQRFGRAGRRGGTGAEPSIAVMVLQSGALDQYVGQHPQLLTEAGAEEARIDPHNVEILLQHLKCAAFELPFRLAARAAPPKVTSGAPRVTSAYGPLSPEDTSDALAYLAQGGLLHAAGDRYHFTAEAFPASHVSLRKVGHDNFVIINQTTGKSLAELDWRAAHTMLHVQAIYQHDGEQYQVERLDFENHKAFVTQVEPDYFTTALTYRSVTLLDVMQERALVSPAGVVSHPDEGPSAGIVSNADSHLDHESSDGVVSRADSTHHDEPSAGVVSRADSGGAAAPRIGLGEVSVVERVTGYKKIKYFTHENAGYGDVHLPAMQMHTQSFWLTLPEPLVERLMAEARAPRAQLIEALRGVGRALRTVATLALMCEPSDLNHTLGDGEEPASEANEASQRGAAAASGAPKGAAESKGAALGRSGGGPIGRVPHVHFGGFHPTLFLFDAVPNGVGLAERIYALAPTLLARAEGLIAGCPCVAGCPGCVGPSETDWGQKRLAQVVARALTG